MDVVRRSCEQVDRDPATLETSMLLTVVPDANASVDQLPAELSQRMVVGSPESIAEQIKTKVLDAGVSGVIFNIPAYRPGVIAETGAALRAVLDA
jgi:alkanesulfonate monooxygenase SsuD/methylene tetrahydromethanopterin reductase-like flavin-dependent oxidoreductase (luciferase family)